MSYALRKAAVDVVVSTIRRLPNKYINDRLEDVLLQRRYEALLVNEQELSEQYRNAIRFLKKELGQGNLGDYLEFGVCLGTSINCLNQVIKDAAVDEMRIFGFDSFDGLPFDIEGEWTKGEFKADYEITRKYLTINGLDWNRHKLIKGWFSDTLTDEFKRANNLTKASLIMIDCDIYQGAKEALAFCAPLIVDKTIVIFDDWNPLARKNKGEKRAFDEFMAAHPEFKAEEFGQYSYQPGDLNGKVFLVSRLDASCTGDDRPNGWAPL